ncbi:MAG: VTT domain-containing protein, partial [Thermodesulfovibrionales bacterium]|nr:VTT domain-containing protein [Thermodesulfovibrionales bacterium]
VFIPSLALTLGAGFIWGPIWGPVFAISGATLGATVPFLLSRYLMGDWVKRRFSEERWLELNTKVRQHGWKAVAFTRIVPIFPYPVLNYLFGITPIPLLHYVGATFVFMLPACITYTAFGSSMGELILKGNITGLIIGIVIASVAMLIPFALKRFVKKVADERS